MKIEQHVSPNINKGRNGFKPDIIVCHITQGAFDGAVSWLCNKKSEASTNFVVAKDGRVAQLVSLEDTAWGNGTTTDPSDKRFYGNANVKLVRERKTSANYFSVSIEHEGFYEDGKGALTSAQLAATIELIKYIRSEVKRIYGVDIPVDREHIVGHCDVAPKWKPNCPGQAFPFDAIIQALTTQKEEKKLDDTKVRFNLFGTKNVEIDGFIEGGKTYVAARELLESMEFNVGWNPDSKTILVGVKSVNDDARILERIVQAEAGGEDEKGKMLVASVILNRVRDSRFPNNIKDVVFQENQFEPTRNGAYDKVTVSEATKTAVARVLAGMDYSQGALYFRTEKGVEGSWHEKALTKLFAHGGHVFYK